MQIYIVLSLIFGILITLFAIFNSAVVAVNFFFTELQIPLALVIIASALIGAVTMLIFDTFRRIRSGKNLKDMTKKANGFEKEIASKDETIHKLEDTLKQKEMVVDSQLETIDALRKNQSAIINEEKNENETVI
ncbi:MAG: DUF1049 domain-containing protein [Clostridia bacterium]|nr:DUF1049 domain-containing protein [Clostridia bacterium]